MAEPGSKTESPVETPASASSKPSTRPPTANGDSNQQSPHSLDVGKLHSLPSEQQGLFLLTFTADLIRHVDDLSPDAISAEQGALKKELLKVINLSSPVPTKTIRNNIGRVFAAIFTKGSRKVLYETINELVAILGAGKEKDSKAKHAALTSLGTIFAVAGDSAMSLSPLACTTILKLYKSSSSETGLRAAMFTSLGQVLEGVRAAIDEELARAIWKQARSTLGSDKSALVQTNTCWCVEQLLRTTPYFDNSNDFEKLQTALWKVFESSSPLARHAAASCLATELVKTFSESPDRDGVPQLRKPRKSKKMPKGEDPEEAIDRASSPAPDKPATALSFTLVEMLRILSTQYNKTATTNKARAGIAVCYIKIIKALGEGVVEQRYQDIARHFFNDVLSFPGLQYNKYRQLITRKLVGVILEHVAGRMLGETAQLNACRFLLNDIIKDYPQAMPERPEPSKQTLIGALSAATSLIRELDAAASSIAELCREAFIQVLQHPSFTVQIHASRALRVFVLAYPQQLLPTVTICMNSVNRELSLLSGPRQGPKRTLGYAHGLAALLSTSSLQPLYGSVDVYARVLQQATSLLKTSGSSDLRISSCQLQVAWVMLGSLMSLGPNFVKIHLSQLMLLWKNALPRPVAKENMSQRNMIELSYLSHVRECALGCMKSFLTHNQRLLTLDVSRRLAAMLENTVVFIQSLPEKKTSDDPSNRLSPALQLQDYEIMVRRRVFHCFSQLLTLSPIGSIEGTAYSSILPLAVSSFSDVDYDPPSSLSAAIASSAASFESIWDVNDNYGFGVTGLVQKLDIQDSVNRTVNRHWTSRQDDEALADNAIRTPVSSAPEYDATSCYLPYGLNEHELPNPPGTETVNAAIAVFGLAFPLQPARVQESLLEQIAGSLGAPILQKDPARKAAITVNTAAALSTACKVATGEVGSPKGDLRRDTTEKALQSLLHVCIQDHDPSVRLMAADAIGRLCSCSGNSLTATEVTYLTDTIVQNREPHVRTGCALALAGIHSQLGGMAAGFHMKTIIGILMSLAADSHPLVHFWALDCLAQVAESAGLNFSNHVSSAIGMLTQLYVSDTHNPETTNLASSNMAVDLDVTAGIVRAVDSVINVLGPDLQDMTKAREMILSLVRLFLSEKGVAVTVEGMRCMEHLSLYAPGHIEYAVYVRQLQSNVDSESSEISLAALHGLAILMRRDAPDVTRTALPGLEERLWDFLNNHPRQPSIRNIFINWLHQTGSSDPADWILRCSNVLTKTKAKIDTKPKSAPIKTAVTAGPDLQDEEIAGFNVSAGAQKEDESQAATSAQELMRWQVRLFAMDCLHNLISMISKEAAVSDDSPGEAALQSKVADVVRIAFSASTAGVAALRVVGMRIIDQVLKMFGRTADPDFPEAMLLEQYQAQISSALTPAFAADSSPELAAAAVSVCATFIATGIVTDIDRMGRILKVLVAALDSFSRDTESASIGDLKALGSNAQVMVRMAVFSAWAELQIASGEQKYLIDVVKPQIAQLVPLWLSSLREYARLRFEPDISASLGTMPTTGDLDTIYAALNRQTLLKFYQDTWLSLVDAIASLIDEDSEFVFDALDSKQTDEAPEASSQKGEINGIARKTAGINYREEPVAFFFVLFGLAFESLAARTNEEEIVVRQRNLDILQALKKILRPSVSGNAVYQEVIFSETMDLLDRMVLTESHGVQAIIVEIARNLCTVHPSSRMGQQTPASGDNLSDDIEQLFELTRIIVLVLAGLIPGLSESPVSARLETSDEAVALVRTALQALVDVSEVFPAIIKTDLHATIFHIFVVVLGTASCQASVVPQALPIFRRFVASIADEQRSATQSQLRNTLTRMLLILKNAQKRETEASVPCEKNTLLAITVLMSAAPKALGNADPLVFRFIDELRECLDSPSTSRVASGCFRTLLLAGVQAPRLVKHALNFYADPQDLEGLDESRAIMAQTLVMYTSGIPVERRPAAMALFVSALVARASQDGPKSHVLVATRLLELAAVDNASFRAIVTGMQAQPKKLLEEILRSRAAAQASRQDVGADHEPTIALKMNFGS